MLTSHAECYATSGSLHLGLSDHDLILTVGKNKNSRPKPRLFEFRNMKNFNLPDFLADLKWVPWSSAYTFENADDVWAHWRTIFERCSWPARASKEKVVSGRPVGMYITWFAAWNFAPKQIIEAPKAKSYIYFLGWLQGATKQGYVAEAQRFENVLLWCFLECYHPGEFWRKMKPLLQPSCGKNIQSVILVEGSSVNCFRPWVCGRSL